MGRKPKPAEVRGLFFTARASGATLRQAAAAAGVCRTTGHYWLAQSGGVRPRVNQPRPPLRLSLDEREAISRGLAAKKTFTAIAAELGRAVSTISREVARNSGPNGYRAVRADRLAVARTARPRAGQLASWPTYPFCARWWRTSWRCAGRRGRSAGTSSAPYPDDPRMRVSHETIYTSLFVQTKAVLHPELTAHLRTRRVRRRPQRRMSLASRRSRIPNMLGIAERPAHVADRVVAGHWEGDLLVGRYGRSHLVTLVERHSRFLLVLPVPDTTTMTVVAAVTRAFLDLPECTRGLLRQYFPKKTDLSQTSPERLQQIVDQLNQRPRESLACKTPDEVFWSATVAMTA